MDSKLYAIHITLNFFVVCYRLHTICVFFFLNDAPPPDIYPLPQHDPLPIFYSLPPVQVNQVMVPVTVKDESGQLVKGLLAKDFSVLENGKKQKLNFFTSDPFALSAAVILDRESTRLNSRHSQISYAVLCLLKLRDAGMTATPRRATAPCCASSRGTPRSWWHCPRE